MNQWKLVIVVEVFFLVAKSRLWYISDILINECDILNDAIILHKNQNTKLIPTQHAHASGLSGVSLSYYRCRGHLELLFQLIMWLWYWWICNRNRRSELVNCQRC